jgi:hypothetical protein
MRNMKRTIATQPYQAGAMSQLIPRVGYLSEIVVRFSGTLDITTAGAPGWRAPWSLLQNARLNVNGNLFPLSADAYGYEILRRIQNPGYKDEAQMPTSTDTGNQTVEFVCRLRPATTESNLTGIIWVGNPSTTTYLEMNWRSATDAEFFGGAATLTGTVEIQTHVFTFGEGEATPDISVLHQFNVTRQNVTSTGENYVNWATLNQVYLRVFHVIENDGAILGQTDGLEIQVKVQQSEDPYTFTDGVLEAEQNDQYHGTVSINGTGARVLDLYETRTLRDVINATGLTLLQSKITIPSSVTITQPANIYTYTETLTPLK